MNVEDYDGADYHIEGQTSIAIPQPDQGLAVNTVTYIKGQGMSLRIVAVPGSRTELFWHDVEGMGLCDCSPPAIWNFIAIDGQTVVTLYTMDSHEALTFMSYPDLLFEAPGSEYEQAGLAGVLPMIPAEEGISMVVSEATEWVALGGDQSELLEEISYSDVTSADIISEFERMLKGENNEEGS